MRRALIIGMCLALAVPFTLAGPAGAKKPATVGLSVSIESNLFWVNAPGDTVVFSLEAANTSRNEMEDVGVTLTISGTEVFADNLTVLKPGDSEAWKLGYAYLVDSMPLEPIVAVLEAAIGTGVVSDSVEVGPVPDDFWRGACPDGIDSGQPTEFVGGFCYHAFQPGYWEIEAEAVPGLKHRDRLGLTMRDHVPGNWCMYGEVSSERPTSGIQTIQVFIPGTTSEGFVLPDGLDWRGPGVCLIGGHGICTEDDCYFSVGNPANFVLAAPEGTVTATYWGTSPPSES